MSMTLNLVDRLLDRARNLRRHGQNEASARVFSRLTGLRDLPADIAEEAHVGLAEIRLEQEQHKQARRHLAAAIAHEPGCAHYHYLMAVAVEDDPHADPKRAGVHYRRSLALDPDEATYQCDYGLFALRHGNRRAGLAALRRAAAAAGDDPEMLGRVAAALREADRADEARSLLRAALFRNPRDRRFRDLWERHQFDMIHAAQQECSQRWSVNAPAPVLLPFRLPKKRVRRVGDKLIRTDGPETIRGPKILPMQLTRKKDA
jgi:Tfp pilus assembly protein PilF